MTTTGKTARVAPGPPMDLGNMGELGVRSLKVMCRKCKAERAVNVDDQPAHLTVQSFGPRMMCRSCGAKGADVRPNWLESKLHIPPP